MPNINAFRPVVHQRMIFEDLSKFALFCSLLGPKGGQPLYLNNPNPHPPSIGLVVHEKKSFKGKS